MNDRLHAYQCQNCGELHYPRHFLCRSCGDSSFAPVRIEGECELLTWTRLYSLPEGFTESCLTFGIVRYPNGIKVPGRLNVGNPLNGMKLKTAIGQIKSRDDVIELGFIFTER